jgi:N-acyl-D-aspartate/D-glutamate deacylase
MGEVVADMLTDTGKMRAMTAELSARLRATSQEVTALTESLRRALTRGTVGFADGAEKPPRL